MTILKHALAFGLSLAMGAGGAGLAMAQGGMMGDQDDRSPGMMMGDQSSAGYGMRGGQGGMGPGMMEERPGMPEGRSGPGMMGGGMGPGMMGSQGGMGPGMMKGMMGGGLMPCPMMGGTGMDMMQPLLEPEQRSQMRELMQRHRPAQFERMGRMMNLRDDLMAEMHGERPDPEAVQELHGGMAELQGEMMAEMVRLRNAMHDLLTEEQRQELQEAPPSAVDPDGHESHH